MILSEERKIRKKLKDDFTHFAHKCLVIRTKEEGNKYFGLNSAQHIIHSKIENQLKETGKVRAIILKGRQQGMSTYIQARFFWKVIHRFGVRAFILTHDYDATNNLFDMVQRFYDNCHHLIKPSIGSRNAKEFFFDKLDSGYKIGTAGNKAVGRSSTIQYFHGSEVAFWPNASDHAKGILQAIPDAAGTEFVLESTANGVGNYFYSQWEMAINGESELQPIFIPWTLQPEYTKPVSKEFDLTDYEKDLMLTYELSFEQMSWRKSKINELSSSGEDGAECFKQEYPLCPEEAFVTSGLNAIVPSEYVMKAMKNSNVVPYGPLVMGVDPAWSGQDRLAIVFRQGRVVFGIETHNYTPDVMDIVGKIYVLIQKHTPDMVFIDTTGGFGAGIVDRLREMGCDNVKGVNSCQKALDEEHYINKKAEMWLLMKKWFIENEVQIPNSDALHKDICSPCFGKRDSRGRSSIEDKDSLKKRGVRSPDLADALALTFAFPVRNTSGDFSKIINPNITI